LAITILQLLFRSQAGLFEFTEVTAAAIPKSPVIFCSVGSGMTDTRICWRSSLEKVS